MLALSRISSSTFELKMGTIVGTEVIGARDASEAGGMLVRLSKSDV